MTALYDRIGLTYADLRRPDPRIARQIAAALAGTGGSAGDGAGTVLNVGAGTGSYEPADRRVIAVEPSAAMIAQRASAGTGLVQARAEQLPFSDNAFDAAMAVLTVHHWADRQGGVAEMRRVTRGNLVFLTFDPGFRYFWLTDYFPDLIALDEGKMPAMAEFETWLGPVSVSPVPVPCDCTDGFLAAYWRRPAAYLDERVRAAISSFWALGRLDGGRPLAAGLARLSDDLESGAWQRRHGHLSGMAALDCGYRLIVSR